jgi:hypothetical protein
LDEPESPLKTSSGARIAAVTIAVVQPVLVAYDIVRVNKISKKPVLEDKDIRFLKKRSVGMPIVCGLEVALGTYLLTIAPEDKHSADRATTYVLSGSCFLTGFLALADAITAHKILKHKPK